MAKDSKGVYKKSTGKQLKRNDNEKNFLEETNISCFSWFGISFNPMNSAHAFEI